MDDVLEMAEMLLRTRNTDALALVQTVEALAAEVRELRKDKARRDWVFASGYACVNVKGAYDWDSVRNREELDAVMGGED